MSCSTWNTFTSLSFVSVNVGKTNYMIYSQIGDVINSLNNMCFGGTIINQVFETRYLGFLLIKFELEETQ
jgi:hypothetical protein